MANKIVTLNFYTRAGTYNRTFYCVKPNVAGITAVQAEFNESSPAAIEVQAFSPVAVYVSQGSPQTVSSGVSWMKMTNIIDGAIMFSANDSQSSYTIVI